MGNSYNSGACNDGAALEIPTGYECKKTCKFLSKPPGVMIKDTITSAPGEGTPITEDYILDGHTANYSCSNGYILSDNVGNAIGVADSTFPCSGGQDINPPGTIQCIKILNAPTPKTCDVSRWTDGKIEVYRTTNNVTKWTTLDSNEHTIDDTEQIKYECQADYTPINKNNNSISYVTHMDKCTNAPSVLVPPSDVECKSTSIIENATCPVTTWENGSYKVLNGTSWDDPVGTPSGVPQMKQIKHVCNTDYTAINKQDNSISYNSHSAECTPALSAILAPDHVECKKDCSLTTSNGVIYKDSQNKSITGTIKYGQVAKYSCGESSILVKGETEVPGNSYSKTCEGNVISADTDGYSCESQCTLQSPPANVTIKVQP